MTDWTEDVDGWVDDSIDGVKSVWAGRVEKMAGRMVSLNYIIRDSNQSKYYNNVILG